MADSQLLAPCPDSPNCVSSLAERAEQRVEPLQAGNNREDARENILQVLRALPRVDVEPVGESRINARFTSLIFRFVDDVTFYIHDNGTADVRSASRVGHWDFGANRSRVDSLREQLCTHTSCAK